MKTKILFFTTVLLAIGTIVLCLINYNLKKEISGYSPQIITKIDTIYVDKPFKVEVYKEAVAPTQVVVYTSEFEKDTVQRDSVVQFLLDDTKLDLTLYSKADSLVHTDSYKLDLENFKYSYSKGVLTQKKKLNLKVSPYIGLTYRPIHNYWDLSAGVLLKIKYFNLSVGYDMGYYPNLSTSLQHDVSVSVAFVY